MARNDVHAMNHHPVIFLLAIYLSAGSASAESLDTSVPACEPPVSLPSSMQSKLLKATVTKQDDSLPATSGQHTKPAGTAVHPQIRTIAPAVKRPAGPTAAEIQAEVDWLSRYRHMRSGQTIGRPSFMKNAMPVVGTPPVTGNSVISVQRPPKIPAETLLANTRFLNAANGQFLNPANARLNSAALHSAINVNRGNMQTANPINVNRANMQAANMPTANPIKTPSSSHELPRWGDKSCLCHEGFRLFQQHKYAESAAYYKKAGDNMLSAWGRATDDVANARRGEAVCYGAMGNFAKAKDLYRDAVSIYLASGARSSAQLQDSILDLSDAYKKTGDGIRATKLSFNAKQLCLLATRNSAMASQQFKSLTE